MPFVNEFISPENMDRYRIKEIDSDFVVGGIYSDQWVIDHERDIYLRRVTRSREEFANQSQWTLFWKGALIVLELHLMDYVGKRKGRGWVHWHLHKIRIRSELESNRAEILEDLKDALTTHKDDCVYSSNTEFEVTFTV